jgi:AraC-like DNA-binding protein
MSETPGEATSLKNDKMAQFPPSHSLANMVKHYLIVEREADIHSCYRLFSDGNPGIVFHFGDPLIQYGGGPCSANRSQEGEGARSGAIQPGSFVYGQITRYNDLLSGGKLGMLVVVLQPYGIYSLLRLPACELNDGIVPIADLFGQEAVELEDQVVSALTARSAPSARSAGSASSALPIPSAPPTPSASPTSSAPPISSAPPTHSAYSAIPFVERFLLRRQAAFNEPDPLIKKALNVMYDSRGIVRMEDLLKKIPVTERQLERKFKEYIGVSPKKISDLIKFHHFLKLLQHHPADGKISDAAYDGGYYDQAHLNNYFKKVAGITPLQYKGSPYRLATNFMQAPVQ